MKLPLYQGFAKKNKIHTALYYININSPPTRRPQKKKNTVYFVGAGGQEKRAGEPG
jgi:hypothetical protein